MEKVLDDPTDPSDWKFAPLEDLDGLFRCSICLEYYRTAMIMPACSHNYCSLCIRRYLAVRSQCPTCAAPVTNSQLRNNRLLDELVEKFTGSRKEFMSLVATHAVVKSKNGLPQIPLAPQRDSTPLHRRAETRGVATEIECSSPSGAKTERKSTACGIRSRPKTDLGSQQECEQPTTSRGSSDGCSSARIPEPPSLLLFEESVLADEGKTSASVSERRASVEKPSVSGFRSGELEDASGSCCKVPSTHTCSEDPFDTDTDIGTRLQTHTSTAMKRQPSTPLPSKPLDPHSSSRMPSSADAHSSPTFSPPSTPKLPPAHKLTIKHEISPVLTPTSSSGCHTPLSVGRGVSTPSPSTSTHYVECPVCGLLIQQRHVNSHLDLCLNRTSNKQSQRSSTSSSGRSLPRLPKLCFNIMKEKQLKNKLREYHLPTHGSRQAMMSRLQEFTLQYNAQCDSLVPKTPQQIAQEVERAEQLRLSKKPAPQQQQPVRRDSTREELEQQRRSYEQEHGDHFAKLIGEVRRRRRGEHGRKKETLAGSKAEGTAERHEGGVRGEERGTQGGVRGDGSSDVEIIERGQEVFAVDSSESGDEVPEGVWAAVSRMGATSVPESPHILRQSTRLKRKRYPTTASPRTPLNRPESKSRSSEREAALSSDEDPDFVLTTPTTPTLRMKKRSRQK